jgi:hypothetical protein
MKTIITAIFVAFVLLTNAQFHKTNVKPVITSFIIPDSVSGLTIPIKSFIAHDDGKVIGYKITESATTPLYSSTGWATTVPTSYTFPTIGMKTIYAWVKDNTKYVSLSLHSHVVVSAVPPPPPPPIPVPIYPTDYPGTEYYISPTGNDAATGTSETTAWKSLPNGRTFKSGDAVLLLSTGTWEGTLTVPSSGITIGAYGIMDSKPKIYGSSVITGWSLHSGNIYKATVSTDINSLPLVCNEG